MTSSTLASIPTAEILASPDQNREVFDPMKLGELAESIRETGLLQPITVRREASLAGTAFVLVAGERRLRACRDVLGWVEIPAIVSDEARSLKSAIATLAENMIRENPGAIEEAKGLAATAAEFGLEPGELAKLVGRRPQWVQDRLALLNLTPDIALFVQSKALPIERAVRMAGLDANRQHLALAAHERGMAIDAFRALCARLSDEQAADSMFDTDSFLRVDEYVVDAETLVEAMRPDAQVIVREQPLGLEEIAQLLEVQRSTVSKWRVRGLFPEPELRVSGSPLWWEQTVRDWAASTDRLP